MKKKRILIVCTGNTCRSPLVEAIIADYLERSALKDKVIVSSGGISAQSGKPAHQYATQIAHELGLSLEGHTTRQVDRHLLDKSDLVLCVTDAHKSLLLHNFEGLLRKCFTLAECVSSDDIGDPYGQGIDAYRKIAADVKNLLPNLMKFLMKFFDESVDRQ
jgi:protein-tyrosine phosphatase